jgi:hypothetical protein
VNSAFHPTNAECRGSVDQLHRPFPGRPGVSQGSLRRFFHYDGHVPVSQGCKDDMLGWEDSESSEPLKDVKKIFDFLTKVFKKNYLSSYR